MYHCLYYYTIGGGASDHVITEEDASALDLLISGCADNNGVYSVVSLANM